MGSGQMVGGFDGWQGPTPGGGGGGSGGVTQIVAGTGIGVSPLGGTGVVTVSNTGVTSIVAGSGIAVDQATGTVTISNAATLASIYAYGLTLVPTTANTMVGTYHSMYFDGADNGIFLYQAPASDGSDFDSHPLIRVGRHFSASFPPGLVAEYETQYDALTNNNFVGGVRFDSFAVRDNGTRFPIVQETHQALRPSVSPPGYTPAYSSTEPYTTVLWEMLNRRGGGNASQALFNSDGAHFRNVILPDSGGPYAYYANLLDVVGTSGLPQLGSEIITDSVSIFLLGYDAPGQHELGHASWVYDAQNSGSGQYLGHREWWGRAALGGTLTRSLQLFGADSSTLSTADVAALSYDTTLDRLKLSNNAGAYSPIATLADIGPAAGTLVAVDVPSASTDFKTATTFTVVPTATGRRFLPIASYIEFTTVAALTVGPSVKLGNNGAHDNVAPVLAVANTVVTDDLVPFVMASGPVVITLTTTGIIGDVTVNATATTATGRVHVVGVYIT